MNEWIHIFKTVKKIVYYRYSHLQNDLIYEVFNDILGDLEVTANIYCKLRNLPNTDTQNYSTDLR